MAVPPIVHAEPRVARGLRDAGAVGPECARPVAATRPFETRALYRLVRAGAVREAGVGRYWLDYEAYRAFRRARLNRVLIVLAVVLVLALAGLLRWPPP